MADKNTEQFTDEMLPHPSEEQKEYLATPNENLVRISQDAYLKLQISIIRKEEKPGVERFRSALNGEPPDVIISREALTTRDALQQPQRKTNQMYGDGLWRTK